MFVAQCQLREQLHQAAGHTLRPVEALCVDAVQQIDCSQKPIRSLSIACVQKLVRTRIKYARNASAMSHDSSKAERFFRPGLGSLDARI